MNRHVSPDAVFIGWQRTRLGDCFPLFNIVKANHPSYGSTVTEKSLIELELSVPSIPLIDRIVQKSEKMHSLFSEKLVAR